jgi:undecaprenyl diphosphate synthase
VSCSSLRKSLYYTEEELSSVWERPLPHHVAIIMDGNRRWARKQRIATPFSGHWAGASVLDSIVEAACDLGIKILTVYGFSTENWGRSSEEIETLLKILRTYLEQNLQKMIEQQVRFHVIGDLTPFSEELKAIIDTTCKATAAGGKIDFVVALNYGGRDEIRRVVKKLIEEVSAGTFSEESITEEAIASRLDTAPFGDPDLLVRTSGEKRISNFLLWQLAYAELHVTETLWPAFTPRDLLNAVLDFQKRQRRKGK